MEPRDDGWSEPPPWAFWRVGRSGRLRRPSLLNDPLPTCKHADAERYPCVVLDPFGGAGTTGLVADRLQRDAILIELNPEYAAMARRRIERDAGMFAEVS